MKKIIIFFALIILLFSANTNPLIAHAEDNDLKEIIDKELNEIDFSSIDNYLKTSETILGKDFKSFIKDILNGEFSINFDNIFQYFKQLFFEKVAYLLPKLTTVIIIALIYQFISEFNGNFDEIKTVCYYACVGAIITIIFSAVTESFIKAQTAITKTSSIMQLISPILLTLMVACGESVSVAIFNPALVFFGNLINILVCQIILPLIKILLTLSLVSGLSPDLKLKGFINFFSSIIKWILGLSFTIFSLYLSAQGIIGGNIDGISIRATKYAISNSVPIIGGFVSGGFNIVIAGVHLIKNAVGVGAIIALLITIFSPLLFIIVTQILLKLISAIISLVSDEKLSVICNSLTKGLSLLISTVIGVAFTFYIFTMILICSTGAFL